MRLTEELVIKFNTILDMLEVGYDHYFDRSDSGHCKLSDGYTSLSFQPYFWWYKGEEPEMEIYSYVLGTSRMHEFDSISEAYRNVREWVREELTLDVCSKCKIEWNYCDCTWEEEITVADIVCFDVETTGVDVFNDRIVTAAITGMTSEGEVTSTRTWLVNPGVDIPKEASDIHGITTEKAREEGKDPEKAIREIAVQLLTLDYGTPIVVMNANFDMSLLHYEAKRIGVHFDPTIFKIIDPLILDRHFDKYRKGSRKLVDLARYYGVDVDESKAHDAEYDNLLAGRVAIEIVNRYNITNEVLGEQPKMYAEWAIGYEKYLKKSNPEAEVNKEWPLVEEK